MLASLFKKMAAAALGATVGSGYALLKQEVAAARDEFQAKMRALLGGAIALGIAIGLLVGSVLILVGAGIAALSLVWPVWLALLVVGGGLLLISLIVLFVGLSKIKQNKDLRPQRAVDAARAAQSFFGRG